MTVADELLPPAQTLTKSPERQTAAVFRPRRMVTSVLLIGPAAALIGLVFVLPVLGFCTLAFTGPDGALASFETLAHSGAYRRVFLNTFLLSAGVTAICLVLAMPIALVMAKARGLWLSLLLYAVLFAFWVSFLVRTFSWMLLLAHDGPINGLLVALGITKAPLTLLFNDVSVLIGMIHVLLPFAILPIYARIRGIDRYLLMASDGLGASAFTTFRLIYLPLLTPAILGAGTIVFLLALGFYVTPALLGGADALTISTLISDFVTVRLAWPMAAASSLVLLVLVIALLAVTWRLLPSDLGDAT